MLPTTLERLRDILREAEFLSTQVALVSVEVFLRDEVRKRAFVRSVEIIGEAAKKTRKPMSAATSYMRVDSGHQASLRDEVVETGGVIDPLRIGELGGAGGQSVGTHGCPEACGQVGYWQLAIGYCLRAQWWPRR